MIAGHTITPLAGAVAIDEETLHAGESPRTIAGTLMSLDSNDNLAMNPTVQALPTPPLLPSPALETLIDGQTTTIDGQAIQVLFNGVSIAGMTLSPGGPAAAVSGTPISLDKTALMIDGSTIPISLTIPTFLTTAIGGQTITAAPTTVVLQDKFIAPGAPGFTVNNQLVSLNKAGSLLIGSRTIALGDASLTTWIDGALISAAATGVRISDGTPRPGEGGWTIDGTKVELDGVGDVVIGGKTIKLDGDGGGGGMGGLILAGLGSEGVAASAATTSWGSGGEAFEGGGSGFWVTVAVVVIIVVVA